MVGGRCKCTRSQRVSRARVGRGMCCNVRHSVAPSTGQSDERLGGHAGAPGGAPPKVAMHSPYSIFAAHLTLLSYTGEPRTRTGRTQSHRLHRRYTDDDLSQRKPTHRHGHMPGHDTGANPAADSVSEEATPANPTLVTLPPPTPRAHLPGVTTVGIKIRWHQPCAAVDSACARCLCEVAEALFRSSFGCWTTIPCDLDLYPERAL